MPRPPRLHIPGACYHVLLRGNHREALFAAPADRQALNEIVAQVLDRIGDDDDLESRFAMQAVDLRIATFAEAARFLHRDPSALTKLLSRHTAGLGTHP
jgi:hypothetical protein